DRGDTWRDLSCDKPSGHPQTRWRPVPPQGPHVRAFGRSSCCVHDTRAPVCTVRVVALYGQKGLLLLCTTFSRETTSCTIRRAGGVMKAPRGGPATRGKGLKALSTPCSPLLDGATQGCCGCRTGDGAPPPEETRLMAALPLQGERRQTDQLLYPLGT